MSTDECSLGPVSWRRGRAELASYFAVSVVALAIDLAIFSFSLRFVGLPWFAAATLGFVVGAFVAYRLSIAWVFAHRRLEARPRHEFAAFAAIGVVGLGFTQLFLWIGIELLQALPELVRVVAAGATFLFNFFVRKVVLFAGRGE